MRERDGVLVDAFNPAFAAMGRPVGHPILGRRHIAHARCRSPEACLGIDQELAGDDNFLARLKSSPNFGLSGSLDADLYIDGDEPAVSLRHHHDTALLHPPQ